MRFNTVTQSRVEDGREHWWSLVHDERSDGDEVFCSSFCDTADEAEAAADEWINSLPRCDTCGERELHEANRWSPYTGNLCASCREADRDRAADEREWARERGL